MNCQNWQVQHEELPSYSHKQCPSTCVSFCVFRLEAAEAGHVGVQQLRSFLEQLLQRRYLDSVPAILPLLDHEYRAVSARLAAARDELQGLQHDKLKVGGCSYDVILVIDDNNIVTR